MAGGLPKGTILEHVSIHYSLQMTENNCFQCVACQPPVCFGGVPAVEEHFLLVHKVPNLLASPATKAVALPSSIFCNRNSCPLPHHCRLCKAASTNSYFGDELKNHMETVHGQFFQHSLHQFCSSHCRSLLTSYVTHHESCIQL